MFGVPATERVFWCNDSCTVRVSYDDTGALVFYGDKSAYMADADEIMARGERSWLDDHGIERGFSSY
jgi:hypothetical protein